MVYKRKYNVYCIHVGLTLISRCVILKISRRDGNQIDVVKTSTWIIRKIIHLQFCKIFFLQPNFCNFTFVYEFFDRFRAKTSGWIFLSYFWSKFPFWPEKNQFSREIEIFSVIYDSFLVKKESFWSQIRIFGYIWFTFGLVLKFLVTIESFLVLKETFLT